ncbi:hypothetical protein HJC23_011932 [Cyclotella cryptica]|uniref:PAS domain-containing protein n=1 Tax=Cyclotella cryptica TaxID=29204 RepID=A0ABD3QQA5_9STRA|eukprot:CCRYP_002962-RA/>CCRYP_002962-RA protein AED:0.07 eAED:0.07 QI:712/1/1/1/0/0/2/162/219
MDEEIEAKRDANCVNSHIRGKRKQLSVDNLISENAELKRQVQILEAVPDLVVAFEFSGRIFFASQSLLECLGLNKPEEVEGTLLWEWITEDSISLLRTAFADALEEKVRSQGDSAPLAGGNALLIHFYVKDEQGCDESILVSLKGVVHVDGDVPECVCSIRTIPADAQLKQMNTPILQGVNSISEDENTSINSTIQDDDEEEADGSRSSKRAKVTISVE